MQSAANIKAPVTRPQTFHFEDLVFQFSTLETVELNFEHELNP